MGNTGTSAYDANISRPSNNFHLGQGVFVAVHTYAHTHRPIHTHAYLDVHEGEPEVVVSLPAQMLRKGPDDQRLPAPNVGVGALHRPHVARPGHVCRHFLCVCVCVRACVRARARVCVCKIHVRCNVKPPSVDTI